jgi:hypothetical protein
MAAVMSEVTQQKSIILRYVFDEDHPVTASSGRAAEQM